MIWQFELIAWKSVEPIEHLSKYLRVEPAIFVECALTEVYESITICHRGKIHKVSCFGSAENSKYLVDSKFLAGENWTQLSAFNW